MHNKLDDVILIFHSELARVYNLCFAMLRSGRVTGFICRDG